MNPVDLVGVGDVRLRSGAAYTFKDDLAGLDDTRGPGPIAAHARQSPDLYLFERIAQGKICKQQSDGKHNQGGEERKDVFQQVGAPD